MTPSSPDGGIVGYRLERDATDNEEEVERVVLAMNEEVAVKDAVKNPEIPVPE